MHQLNCLNCLSNSLTHALFVQLFDQLIINRISKFGTPVCSPIFLETFSLEPLLPRNFPFQEPFLFVRMSERPWFSGNLSFPGALSVDRSEPFNFHQAIGLICSFNLVLKSLCDSSIIHNWLIQELSTFVQLIDSVGLIWS